MCKSIHSYNLPGTNNQKTSDGKYKLYFNSNQLVWSIVIRVSVGRGKRVWHRFFVEQCINWSPAAFCTVALHTSFDVRRKSSVKGRPNWFVRSQCTSITRAATRTDNSEKIGLACKGCRGHAITYFKSQKQAKWSDKKRIVDQFGNRGQIMKKQTQLQKTEWASRRPAKIKKERRSGG